MNIKGMAICIAALLAASYIYLTNGHELLLLLIPFYSLLSVRHLREHMKASLSLFFIISFFISAYLQSLRFRAGDFGDLSYIFLVSIIIILLAERMGGEHE
jgi:glycopeptide antibiotics resistance protein